ncbi:hypothetical protein Sjap_016113 [Stephania japonica]|uniref:DUF220 domain-containing protein n=1 Tax=Stephania japonica TaxID=461633 RepID=A0AAP0IM11_9MAGN
MGDSKSCCSNQSTISGNREEARKAFDLKFQVGFAQIPQRLQNFFKFKNLLKDEREVGSLSRKEKEPCSSSVEVKLDKQLKCWTENPTWVDQTPELKVIIFVIDCDEEMRNLMGTIALQVTVPKGSLCNLHVKLKVGLPPDAIYNIVTDPENKRVFKNIKEVISRRVLVDEGPRQLVEVEQAAIWRFLWWSGTISVHVLVDQNREDLTLKFKQLRAGFMEKFEGCWKVEPLFIDEQLCHPFKPKTLDEYNSCTGGKGRVGSLLSLVQLVQPAILPPPPLSWYLRGITARTTEMLISDLAAEAARIRDASTANSSETSETSENTSSGNTLQAFDVKERWRRSRNARRRNNRKLSR